MKSFRNTSLLAVFLIFSCTKEGDLPLSFPQTSETQDTISYLALGDSYTIGQSVDSTERFPVQLVDSLRRRGYFTDNLRIIAKTGWTTTSLQNAILAAELEKDLPFDLLTLLIGVNNQFVGAPLSAYKGEFLSLLQQCIAFSGNRPDRILVLSIPDYSITPFGQALSGSKQDSIELEAFNAANDSICNTLGITRLDITDISREAVVDPSLLASDGLHPSGKMYTDWVEEMIPLILKKLQ